jgi:hypothetical protein
MLLLLCWRGPALVPLPRHTTARQPGCAGHTTRAAGCNAAPCTRSDGAPPPWCADATAASARVSSAARHTAGPVMAGASKHHRTALRKLLLPRPLLRADFAQAHAANALQLSRGRCCPNALRLLLLRLVPLRRAPADGCVISHPPTPHPLGHAHSCSAKPTDTTNGAPQPQWRTHMNHMRGQHRRHHSSSLEAVPQHQQQRQALALLVRARGGLGGLRGASTDMACAQTHRHDSHAPLPPAAQGSCSSTRCVPCGDVGCCVPVGGLSAHCPAGCCWPQTHGWLLPGAQSATASPAPCPLALRGRGCCATAAAARSSQLSICAALPALAHAAPAAGTRRHPWHPHHPPDAGTTHENASQLVKHPVRGGIQPLHVLLGPTHL